VTRIALDDPRLYLNRHLQWMAFNHRVLEEARDPGTPLLERVKFLAITANNLDEFVEIRASSFLQKITAGKHRAPEPGCGQNRNRRSRNESRGTRITAPRKNTFLRSAM
jgi:polyphosphate kinase